MNNRTHLHPLERSKNLDSRLRRIMQNPHKILKKYIQPEMTVLDLGCGTGYFTLELAKLVGLGGKVVAIDVQSGMLDLLKQKIQGTELTKQIEIFQEIKYIDKIISELSTIVKSETQILISEQKFHVSKQTFELIIKKMENNGYKVVEKPKIFLSRTVIMKSN